MYDRVEIFYKDYYIKGKHAQMIRKLIAQQPGDVQIFSNGIELYMTAAIVGCFYDRTANIDKDETITDFRIPAETFNNHYYSLLHTYKLVLLVSDSTTLDNSELINRSLRNPYLEGNNDLFITYVLGGIEKLHEHFFSSVNPTPEEQIINIFELLSDFKFDEEVDDPFAES